MALSIDITKRYTYADYLTWADGKMRELINGFIRMMTPAVSTRHQRISREIEFALVGFIRKHKGNCEVFYAPFDVRFPKKNDTSDDKIDTVVQPDICVVCDPSKIDEKGCLGAPDMIVEIQSPSTAKYDLREKFDLYQEAGVREYWVVHQDKAVDVFILQPDGKYDKGTFYQVHETVPVHVLKGCEIKLEEIFNRT